MSMVAIVTVISSILWIVTHFKGATQAFPIIKALCTPDFMVFNSR